ncbi:YbfB/YjiJ family MFS transporter [Bordetella genomosp. 4]|uniref:MFS transporter n=1 Tax=Bordetella genomosp. 4 TaxID=463044 RepID=A0A261TV81_9BORD|nr:YbfB/YjiJ family MFS transporter [Bordetella genomosp. 4]OZI52920.1 MFS transporter [Bordetella genomosp. 4]
MELAVTPSRHSQFRSAIEAALILAVGMGFGRFAFTAIYPHMVEEGVISMQGGSWAASANYAGYLLGAVLAVRMRAHDAHRLCIWSAVGTAICLALLAFLDTTSAIVVARGIAGIFSALSMVAASLWLLEHRGHGRGAPLLYAGVGVGIALSSEILVLGAHTGLQSQGMWLLLGVVTLVLGLVAVPGIRSAAPISTSNTALATDDAVTVAAWPLICMYGLAGLGYIVTATYLPLLVKTALPTLDAAHVWAVFGLGAAPSCFLWHKLHQRIGTRNALLANLVLQAIGVALPAVSQSAASYLLSALLVGGTFMGTVTIAMPAAQRVARATGRNLLAAMTLVYGVGQILGPALAERLYASSQSFSSSLLAAAAALLVGALLCFRL